MVIALGSKCWGAIIRNSTIVPGENCPGAIVRGVIVVDVNWPGVGEGLCPGGSYPGENCPGRVVLEPNLRSDLYVLIILLYCVKEMVQ